MTGSNTDDEWEDTDRPTTGNYNEVEEPHMQQRGTCNEFIRKELRILTNSWEILTDDEDEEVQGEVLGETTATLPQAPMDPPGEEGEGWLPAKGKRHALRLRQNTGHQHRDAGPRTHHGDATTILSTYKSPVSTISSASCTAPSGAWAPSLRRAREDEASSFDTAGQRQDVLPGPP